MQTEFMDNEQKKRWVECVSLAESIVKSYRAQAPNGFDPKAIEGWAAAAVAVAAVGASAYSAYSSSKSQQDQLNYEKNNAPVFHSYQPVLASYDPSQAAVGYNNLVASQGAKAQATANTLNGYYQQSLQTLDPNLKKNSILASNNANSLLKGNIPTDVSQATARAAAQAGLTGGFGGSEAGRNLLARDLGTTSLALQGQGAQLAGQNATLSAALNPNTATSILGTGADYANRFDRYNLFNTQEQNEAAKDNAGIQNQNSVNQYNAGLAGVQAAGISPVGNSIASGVGALASVYGGGGAGGYASLLRGASGGSGYGSGGNPYDANTASASYGGGYNPYLDTNNYDTNGNFYGNANSFYGGTG